MPKSLRTKAALTSGEFARVCCVCARTVCHWCERGLLPHFRVPGSRDRRILRADARAFLVRYGIPLGPLADGESDAEVPPEPYPPPVIPGRSLHGGRGKSAAAIAEQRGR